MAILHIRWTEHDIGSVGRRGCLELDGVSLFAFFGTPTPQSLSLSLMESSNHEPSRRRWDGAIKPRR
jgi:hypothetical protein